MGATHLVDSVVACAAEGLAVEDLVAGRLQSTPYGLVAPERICFSRAAEDFDISALQSLLVCEMHRGESDAIFTSPLSSEPKCLSFIALLLEARFYHAQDRRRCKSTVRRVMHHPVGVTAGRYTPPDVTSHLVGWSPSLTRVQHRLASLGPHILSRRRRRRRLSPSKPKSSARSRSGIQVTRAR